MALLARPSLNGGAAGEARPVRTRRRRRSRLCGISFPPASSITLASSDADTQITLSTHEMGEGDPVVLCHGFPDFAFGWRNQMPAIADAGFRAIAPDQRGCGRSSAPLDPAAYTITQLTDDLAGLLDRLEIERAFFVGHDWGGFVVWAMAVLHPERVRGVAALCTPYMAFPSVERHLAVVGGDVIRQYVAWFQEPGAAEAEMNQHVEAILTRIFRSGIPLREALEIAMRDGSLNMNPFHQAADWPLMGEPLCTDDELARYVETFERCGFAGGINWYRNIDRNAAEHPEIGRRRIEVPCLMLTAELDPGLRPEFADGMERRVPHLTRHDLKGVAHWIQQEAPDQVNGHLIDWLTVASD